ncbi:MAG TPA: N-formylglutamate amidohydrolase [Rhizomicrobium sp.]|nr:N-formylglutamate amidohydrolase [Rhizomicrobium sp.]
MPVFPRKEQDPVLEDLIAEPVRVVRPQRQRVPFVFASPHSGRLYPPSFVEKSRLNATTLRRSEDAFVEELFEPCRELGAPMLIARFPRAYLDANRAPIELDPTMFDGALPFAVDRGSPRVHAGLGIIPRVVREGTEIYRAKLPVREAEFRIQNFYRPYHLQLARLVEATRAVFGVAVVVDCHSMPSAAASPDAVIGDRLGLSAFSEVTAAAERALAGAGFSVVRNAPYAGGHTIHLYGRPGDNVHALQIEINRGLYLDEERVERGSRFAQVRRSLGEVLHAFVSLVALESAGAAARIAAE